MKRIVGIRNIIIILLCITIISLGIGFSYLSVKLESLKDTKEDFNISFVEVITSSKIQGGEFVPALTYDIMNYGKTIKLKANMYAPRDELSVKLVIKNQGTIPGEIISIVERPDYTDNDEDKKKIYPISITHNKVDGKVLNPGEEIELNIVMVFSSKEVSIEQDFIYELNIVASTPMSQ